MRAALLISSILADGPGAGAGADGPGADVDPIGTLHDPWNDAPGPGTEANLTAMWRTSGAGWAAREVLGFLVGG